MVGQGQAGQQTRPGAKVVVKLSQVAFHGLILPFDALDTGETISTTRFSHGPDPRNP
jgi:hypothetical protein